MAEIDTPDGSAPTSDAEDERGGVNWLMILTASVMAIVIGGFAAWATSNLGVAGPAFIVAALASGYFLYQKRIPSEAVGSGLYITALVMIVTPILFYLPVIGGADTETAEGAGAAIGSVIGIFIWGFVFLLLAIVTAAIGYFAKGRASKKLAATEE